MRELTSAALVSQMSGGVDGYGSGKDVAASNLHRTMR